MTKRMFSRPRKKSAPVAKPAATVAASAPSADKPTGYQERRVEVRETLDRAMKALTQAQWARETPEIIAAQAELDETVTQYCQGAVGPGELKRVYQTFARLHT